MSSGNNHFAEAVLGGWQISAIARWNTGLPNTNSPFDDAGGQRTGTFRRTLHRQFRSRPARRALEPPTPLAQVRRSCLEAVAVTSLPSFRASATPIQGKQDPAIGFACRAMPTQTLALRRLSPLPRSINSSFVGKSSTSLTTSHSPLSMEAARASVCRAIPRVAALLRRPTGPTSIQFKAPRESCSLACATASNLSQTKRRMRPSKVASAFFVWLK